MKFYFNLNKLNRMCAQFKIQMTKDELEELGIHISNSFDSINERILPSKTAPVIVKSSQNLKLTGMRFSLVPSWSKESKLKFATHNARIETVLEKPTWRKPFESQHCVVPMTGFFESVYDGAKAGNIIQFHKPDKTLLFAAGVFDFWKNPILETDSFFSFSILTTEPTKFILENGHDRSPIFLNYTDAQSWLTFNSDPKSQIDFLLAQNQKPDLVVEIDRPLKAGWEKRK